MSDLQRSFARSHLNRLPPAPLVFEEIDEDADSVADLPGQPSPSKYDSSSSASSTGTIVPSASQNLFERPSTSTIKQRNSPLPWQDFFAQDLFLDQSQSDHSIRHHVYLTPPTADGPLFVTHHGAGSSGLSFATFTKEIQKLIPNAGVLSFDARGHGMTVIQTQTGQDMRIDMSLSTLADDLEFVLQEVPALLKSAKPARVILLGHSLGGAVVTEVAHRKRFGNIVVGYGVFDVVEGSAIDALQSMEQYLSTRPTSFPSLIGAIEWHLRSRTIRDSTSARVSVPSLLVQISNRSFEWITDLAATKPFWQDWFTGLSNKFLGVPGTGKLLILAGTDRLDKELMIGQMQGKYQLQVFPEAGHFVHEDQPEKTAQVVAEFWRRNDRSTLVLPPKVDELIKQGKIKASSH